MDYKKVNNLLIDYLQEVTKDVREKAASGKGREVFGEVINRPEDIEIGIDRVGEEILENLLKKNDLKATVFTEPDGRDIKTGGEEPEIYGSIDPFDGSVLFLRGFEHNWYSVISFFDMERNPIACGIADILNEKIYVADDSGNYLMDIKKRTTAPIFPSERKTLAEPVVLASYVMSSQYSSKFLNIFKDLLGTLHPKALLYPQGGSFIYAYLAAGLVDAYIMFNEPRSEIDPGFYIAKKAGCQILAVDEQGNFKDYEFFPGKQHDKVDFLLAVLSPQIRDAIISHYVLQVKKRTQFSSP